MRVGRVSGVRCLITFSAIVLLISAFSFCTLMCLGILLGGTFGTHAFSVAGPTVWNSLPDCLRHPAVDSEQFRRDLKTYLFAGHSRR